MTDEAKQARLAAALRENLKRRKGARSFDTPPAAATQDERDLAEEPSLVPENKG